MGVYGFTNEHGEKKTVSFHMPGHKGSDLYRRFGFEEFLKDFPDRDITEIAGADNLFQPEGIIADTMAKYRDLYGTKATYLLINGSSAGLIASIMTCVEPGGKIILARNCHKSIFNALRLGGIKPTYVHPKVVPEYGIAGQVDPEDVAFAIKEAPDAKAIVLPSPNYYGICSDISAIADLAHEAGMYLIVDQAHGAHLKFFERAPQVVENEVLQAANIAGTGPNHTVVSNDHHSSDSTYDGHHSSDSTYDGHHSSDSNYDRHHTAAGILTIPASAETSGADLVINSTHKTLGTLTQTAILNVCTDGVDLFDLEDKLQMIQSTSPSYILMESLDINADILAEHGDQLIEEWYENLLRFYREVKYVPGLKTVKSPWLDPTKIDLDMSRIGLDGAALDEELMERGIFAELHTGDILMCMTGIGNTGDDYDRLLTALKEIAWKYGKEYISALNEMEPDSITWREGMEGFEEEEPDHSENRTEREEDGEDVSGPASVWTSRRKIGEIPTRKRLIPLTEAEGRVCATALIPYPPGIPMVCPGEVIGREDIEHITTLREKGEKVIGVDPEGRISVGE